VHKHGGIDKLEVYAGLEVPEVWFWENEQLAPYKLVGESYEPCERSVLLPTLDLVQLSQIVREADDQSSAVRRYRDLLRLG
jgi:hypothetical protein